MPKALIFDCFGVIVTDALQAMVDRYAGGDQAKTDQMRDIIVAANRGFLERTEMHRQVADLLGITLDELHANMKSGEVKDHQLLDYIRELRRAGYQTALLSNVSAGGLRHRFSQEELDAHFDTVVASGEIGYAKPEPQAYEITAERLGRRLDECVMIDDRELCVEGAVAVGMAGVVYESVSRLRKRLEAMPD